MSAREIPRPVLEAYLGVKYSVAQGKRLEREDNYKRKAER